MAYMNFQQQDITKRIIQMFSEQNPNHPLTKEAETYELIKAVDADALAHSLIEDVELVVDNVEGAEALTDEDIASIAQYVRNHHDYSSYNDYIAEVMQLYIRKGGKF